MIFQKRFMQHLLAALLSQLATTAVCTLPCLYFSAAELEIGEIFGLLKLIQNLDRRRKPKVIGSVLGFKTLLVRADLSICAFNHYFLIGEVSKLLFSWKIIRFLCFRGTSNPAYVNLFFVYLLFSFFGK